MSFGRDPRPLPAPREGWCCTAVTVQHVLCLPYTRSCGQRRGALGQRRGPDPNSRTSALLAGIPGRGRKSRSDRLPEFILGGPPEPPGPAEEHVHGHADKRVLRDPLALSPALA